MIRLSKLMVATGILSVVGMGFGASSLQAQVPSGMTHAPRSLVMPGTYTSRFLPSVITPRRNFTQTTYATYPMVSRPQSTWSSATRDYSTGRDNLPLSKPWLRPLP